MRKHQRILSAVMALSLFTGLTACNKNGNSSTEETTVATTTAATVEVNTATLSAEEAEKLDNVSSQLRDTELENKTIKWLAHYDKNPSTSGQSKSVALEMFEKKYGGKIEWYPTTWNTRYNDLSTMVLGGEGIDFFPGDDTANFPKGIISGMFQPINDYIDINSPLWQQTAAGMELYKFGDNYYSFVTSITAEAVVIYSKSTIEAAGLDDPYTLWKEGNWNWDTFKGMLLDFCDEDADQWGLDGWWAEKALLLSAGVPIVTTTDSGLVCNVNDATVEKAMNYQYDLFTNGLVFPKDQFAWTEHPEYMGEGKQLFYVCGIWTVTGAPETWVTKISPEDLMIAPVPSPADSDKNYQAATLGGFALCKGAKNPLGVALYSECEILASLDEAAIEISDRKLKDDAKWSDELVAISKEINETARLNPVIDLTTGCSTDVTTVLDGGSDVGVRAALHGVDWITNREAIADVAILLIDEVDQQLKAKMAE